MIENEDEDTRDMIIRFVNNLHKLALTTNEKTEERERLMKIKAIYKERNGTCKLNTGRIPKGSNDMHKVTNAIYVMETS